MFERWTDRSRESLRLAGVFARGLGYSQVGTGHLLLGFLAEGECVAAKALAKLGVTLNAASEDLQARDLAGARILPEDVDLPYSGLLRRTFDQAVREALQLGNPYIGTEHLLLGLVSQPGDLPVTAVAVLGHLGVTPGAVREAVLCALNGYSEAILPLPPRAAVAFEPARFEEIGCQVARGEARDRLAAAALRYVNSVHLAGPHADADAEAEYAGEQLELAAAMLTAAVDAVPAGDRPAGWPARDGTPDAEG